MTSSRNSALAGLGLQRNRQQKRADARAARRRAERDAARAMCRRGTNTLTAASHRHWPRTGTRSRNSRARPLRSRTRLVRGLRELERLSCARNSARVASSLTINLTRCPCAARTDRAAARHSNRHLLRRRAIRRHHRVLSPLMVVADRRGVVSKILEGQWSRRPRYCRFRSLSLIRVHRFSPAIARRKIDRPLHVASSGNSK